MKAIRLLTLASIFLAVVVVTLGAFTRLTDAGLGCPDWPGCYGLIDVPETTEQISKAEQAFPERPVEPQKAWNEMIHRYFAGTLGLFILAIAVLCLKYRQQQTPVKLSLLLLTVVVFQAALGMWTVTLKLMPIIVMAHLLGGFTTLCLLFLLYLRVRKQPLPTNSGADHYRKAAFIGMAILIFQIALGGWTSSNYAALVCTELPICQSGWQENLSMKAAFDPLPPVLDTYEYGHLDHYERVTIHVMHRIGAIITTVYLAWLAIILFRKANTLLLKRSSLLLIAILTTQVSLGVSNIWFSLPLMVAVAHNIVAACLLLSLIFIVYQLNPKPIKQTNDVNIDIKVGAV